MMSVPAVQHCPHSRSPPSRARATCPTHVPKFGCSQAHPPAPCKKETHSKRERASSPVLGIMHGSKSTKRQHSTDIVQANAHPCQDCIQRAADPSPAPAIRDVRRTPAPDNLPHPSSSFYVIAPCHCPACLCLPRASSHSSALVAVRANSKPTELSWHLSLLESAALPHTHSVDS